MATMTQRLAGKTIMSIPAVGAFLVLGIASVRLLYAQSATDNWEKAAGGKMSFDVASVKQNSAEPTAANWHSNVPLNQGDDFTPTDGLFSASNQWFTQYLIFAYKLTQYQYRSLSKELPGWANDNRYDIEARAAGDPTKDQYRLMMQSLLSDRFKFAFHSERKQAPVLALVLVKRGKLGPKLQPHSPEEPCIATITTTNGPAPTDAAGFSQRYGVIVPIKASAPGLIRFGARNVRMVMVADWLLTLTGTDIDKPVIDKTELGTVDFVIEYSPDVRPNPNFTPDSVGPAFLQALKDQAGLKLEQQIGDIETFVVDHVEQPSPN
jgi:uncharacterized protein (TIGR03435 family)